ncbi:branched-chain amino acid transporter permease [Cloacibacillus sp. An23]|uniref:branched-chain amino acid transporter permease n=1 Tax=Cloacibacillus sp. An23 TaxID=1965591 RepID=UPI000B3A3AAE|nr:branched-chain amino acid transporter permease [Cloacibacillus sp. An23]OUO92873.1 branched-chain amino acid transporter AzlD [Cloacibacillus sp. An23]
MTQAQEIMTIAICVAGTMATRFLPFIIFREGRPVPAYVRYLGKALPSAIFAMLVVYCLKDVRFAAPPHGLPEFIAIAVTVLLHLWRRSMMLSIFCGTACYMALVQFVF